MGAVGMSDLIVAVWHECDPYTPDELSGYRLIPLDRLNGLREEVDGIRSALFAAQKDCEEEIPRCSKCGPAAEEKRKAAGKLRCRLFEKRNELLDRICEEFPAANVETLLI